MVWLRKMLTIKHKTEPRKSFTKDNPADPHKLIEGRYGTPETVDIWGPENTFEYSLNAQGASAQILAKLHPDIVPQKCADEISEKASLKYIDPNRIREIEEKTGHDVIAINNSLGEKVRQRGWGTY